MSDFAERFTEFTELILMHLH